MIRNTYSETSMCFFHSSYWFAAETVLSEARAQSLLSENDKVWLGGRETSNTVLWKWTGKAHMYTCLLPKVRALTAKDI